MMNDNFSVTDELLTAYLDGAVSEQEQAELEAAFEADPELAQRLEALQVPGGIFASAFDLDAMDAPQMPEALRCGSDAGCRQHQQSAAFRLADGAGCLFCVGHGGDDRAGTQ